MPIQSSRRADVQSATSPLQPRKLQSGSARCQRFVVAHTASQEKSAAEKEAHFSAFLSHKPTVSKRLKVFTSANGVLTLPASPRIDTKPGQRKRPRAERARDIH